MFLLLFVLFYAAYSFSFCFLAQSRITFWELCFEIVDEISVHAQVAQHFKMLVGEQSTVMCHDVFRAAVHTLAEARSQVCFYVAKREVRQVTIH